MATYLNKLNFKNISCMNIIQTDQESLIRSTDNLGIVLKIKFKMLREMIEEGGKVN